MMYVVSHSLLELIRTNWQLVIYLVCFDLSQPQAEQRKQIKYWLEFLHSSFPPLGTAQSNKQQETMKIFVVGTKSDQCKSSIPEESVASWKTIWGGLPITEKLFCISSSTSEGIEELYKDVERECVKIFDRFVFSAFLIVANTFL